METSLVMTSRDHHLRFCCFSCFYHSYHVSCVILGYQLFFKSRLPSGRLTISFSLSASAFKELSLLSRQVDARRATVMDICEFLFGRSNLNFEAIDIKLMKFLGINYSSRIKLLPFQILRLPSLRQCL